MRGLALLAAVAFGAACKEKPPPRPPASLTAALAAVDDAVRHGGDVTGTCEVLARELGTHAQSPLPPAMKADLTVLSREVMVLGATTEPVPGVPMPVGPWETLKSKIDRVLAGKNPTEGPRYQLAMPENVRSGMENVDAALARGDAEEAVRAISALHGPLAMWVEKLPGRRGQTINEVIELDLLNFGMTGKKDLASVQAFWTTTRKKLLFEEE